MRPVVLLLIGWSLLCRLSVPVIASGTSSSTPSSTTATHPPSFPEASSSLLRLQKLYLRHPPHDTALYDRLHVSSNATAREISQSYRRLCRVHHPDKQPLHNHTTTRPRPHHENEFDVIQQAYEVLKDDTTRLVYHQYGILDSAQAVQILTGQDRSRTGTSSSSATSTTVSSSSDLLRLMGYPTEEPTTTTIITQQERTARIASQLLEQLRVVVEGQVSRQVLLDAVMQECEALKHLPMGAQIVRCVGRAYRHSGQKALATTHVHMGDGGGGGGMRLPVVMGMAITERLRERFRDAKHLADAVVTSGRALVAEHRLESRKQKRKRGMNGDPAMEYRFDMELGELTSMTTIGEQDDEFSVDGMHHDGHDQHDLQFEQYVKTHATLLESLQVEALWKVTKMELDKVVRQACELVLSGGYFYVSTDLDGWIGSRNGQAVQVTEGMRRAAELLIEIGDIMVEQSKEGTAWLE